MRVGGQGTSGNGYCVLEDAEVEVGQLKDKAKAACTRRNLAEVPLKNPKTNHQ
jgi:hypothetical protein